MFFNITFEVKPIIMMNKALILLVLFFSFSLFSQNEFKVRIDNIKEGDSILRVSFNENSSDLKFIKK